MQYTREERGDLSRMSENIVGANPIPLGLAGLALTVALFGTFNAGELRMGSLMTSMMMLLFGGVVTFICAVFAYL
jgi:succinate-acetate transporter protein